MFNIEQRYWVFKRKDLEAAGLTLEEKRTLRAIAEKVETARLARGRQTLNCICIESHWPEYQPTIEALAKRMEKTPC